MLESENAQEAGTRDKPRCDPWNATGASRLQEGRSGQADRDPQERRPANGALVAPLPALQGSSLPSAPRAVVASLRALPAYYRSPPKGMRGHRRHGRASAEDKGGRLQDG